jgi:hypothetical protein
VLVLVGVAALTAACGPGGARLSEREYIDASSAVCARSNRTVARIDVPKSNHSTRVQYVAQRVVEIHRASLQTLRALRPPKTYESIARLWTALVDQSLDELEAVLSALRHDDHNAAAVYAENAALLADRASAVAREHGITACTVPHLTA